MLKRKITLKHIAQEMDVSISTVSKALKNSEEIGRDTKERIQAFAKLYNYKPNNIAVSLKNKRTKNIGVILPEIVHHFFTTVVRGIEHYANSKGYNVIVCLSDESFDKEVINMEMLANGSIDGFIMSLSRETQKKGDYNHLREVTEQGIPLVLFDRVTPEIDCDKVIIDDMMGGYMATKKLLDEGRKHIALVTSNGFLSVNEARYKGYQRALEEHGISLEETSILKLNSVEVEEESVIEKFFKSTEVDGVLSINEVFGIFVIRVLQKIGLKIPKDISVIGFTNGLLSQYFNPGVTAIDQHGQKMGETAARMFINRVESNEEEDNFQTKILSPTMVLRESTLNTD